MEAAIHRLWSRLRKLDRVPPFYSNFMSCGSTSSSWFLPYTGRGERIGYYVPTLNSDQFSPGRQATCRTSMITKARTFAGRHAVTSATHPRIPATRPSVHLSEASSAEELPQHPCGVYPARLAIAREACATDVLAPSNPLFIHIRPRRRADHMAAVRLCARALPFG